MNMHWRPGRLGVAGFTVAAIAIAAVPEAPPPASGAPTARAVERTRARATVAAPGTADVQLDMARLRRLQPGRSDVAVTAAATPLEDENVNGNVDADSTEDPMAPVENPAVAQKAGQEAPGRVEIVNAFAPRSWYVPPPPPPAPPPPPPPPKPTAPPLPFTYIGSYENPGSPSVIMLVRGDRLYTVSEGDSIDGTYKIDRVEKGRVEMTYLPLKQKQVLLTGEPG